MGVSKIDPAIIVIFVRRDVRDQFYASRKHFRGKSTRDIGLSRITEHKIYIGESLTQQFLPGEEEAIKLQVYLDINWSYIPS